MIIIIIINNNCNNAIILSINIQVGLNMHLYDDIGDASSSLWGSTSSLLVEFVLQGFEPNPMKNFQKGFKILFWNYTFNTIKRFWKIGLQIYELKINANFFFHF